MKRPLLPLLILTTLVFAACNKDEAPEGIDFRQEMRDFVQDISATARLRDNDFIVIPQNGAEILSQTTDASGPLDSNYVAAISGISREDLFYGYEKDDKATPAEETAYMRAYLDKARTAGLPVMVTDYCSTHGNMDDSYTQNDAAGYIGLAAPDRELRTLPDYPAQPHNVNANDITQLGQIQNYLYLLQADQLATTKQGFVDAIAATNYDLVLIDLYYSEDVPFTPTDIAAMQLKANGGRRLLICYMSIGEAESYRYYWQDDWKYEDPQWLRRTNRQWKGNYKVWYWDPEWQGIILHNSDSYLNRILDTGYDGVFLDIIDGFDYFENL